MCLRWTPWRTICGGARTSLIGKAHEKAIGILKENLPALHELAHYLLDRETITGEEFMAILKKYDEPAALNG